MGLAASQCRLLVLTQRKSDLEFRAQNITNRKLLLSGQTQNLATNYSDKLNNYITEFTYDVDSNGNAKTMNETLTIDSIYAVNSHLSGNYRVRLADGRIAVSDTSQLASAISQSKGTTVATAAELYAGLSNNEKITYMKEAITGMVKASNNSALPEAIQSVLNKKVLNKDVGNVKKGNLVSTRRDELKSLLTEVYAVAGIKQLTQVDEKGEKPESICKFNSFTSVNNMSSDQLKALKNLSTMSNLPQDITDKWLEYYKEFDGNSEATSVPKLNEDLNADFGKTKASEKETAQKNNKKAFAAFIYALNDYLKENPTTTSSNEEFLNSSVLASSDYANIANKVKDEDTMTLIDYLKAEQVNAEDTTDTSKAEEASIAIYKLMNSLGNTLVQLLQTYSTFGDYVVAQTQGTNYSDCPQISDNEIYCQSTGETYIILPGLKNYRNFQNAIQTGSLYLEQQNKDGGWDSVVPGASSVIKDRLYTEDDNAAQAEYDSQTAIIQRQDKMLDVELKQIETQQKACDNEIDSVKKILDKNVERSFKVFS